MWLTSVAAGVFVIARSPDVKLLLAWLAKVFTGLPHGEYILRSLVAGYSQPLTPGRQPVTIARLP